MAGPWCRKCRYDLAGVAPAEAGSARCPECGRSFDPADPATTLAKVVPWWRTPLAIRVGRSGAVVLLFVVAFWFNWLPRPATTGLRLWEWGGKVWGVARDTAGGRPLELRFRADEITRVTGFEPSGERAFIVTSPREGAWRIDIRSDKVTLFEVEAAARRLGDFVPDIAFHGDRPAAPGIAVVEGDATQVMEGLLELYGIEPRVFIRRFNEDRFLLRVSDPSVGFETLMDIFNSVRDRRFGVFTFPAPTTAVPAPFEIEGSEADAFWGAVRAYDRIVNKPELVPAMTDGWHPTGDPAPSYQEAPRRRA